MGAVGPTAPTSRSSLSLPQYKLVSVARRALGREFCFSLQDMDLDIDVDVSSLEGHKLLPV